MKYKMVNSVRVLALLPMTVLCLVSVAAQAQTSPLPDPPAGMQNMPRSGDTDKDFAMMMRMHHQQGVDMAKIELEQGKSPEMKAMAKRIISAQQKEILRFDQWLANQK
jgi:uncharacterized protein (DUF305 family)